MNKSYLAEGLGTFSLALAVSLAVAAGPAFPLAVPVLAALVVGLFVYTIGPVSGCHINPAVTLGALWMKKISQKDAIGYIVSQGIGAAAAMVVSTLFLDASVMAPTASFSLATALAELAGTFFLTFGIASVMWDKTPAVASGAVIGGSLLLGVLMASLLGSAGILNPAVALAVGSLNISYLVGPIIGSMLGMWAFRRIQ